MRGTLRIPSDAGGSRSAMRSFPLPSERGAALRALRSLLRSRGLSLRSCSAIRVVPGPGRFSSIRLGAILANTLGWALGIPVFCRGRRVALAVPEYPNPPSITTDLSLK